MLLPAALSGIIVRWLNASLQIPALSDGSQPTQSFIAFTGMSLSVALYFLFLLQCGFSRGNTGYNVYGKDPRE